MELNKKIGIIVSKVYKEINTRMLSGILEQAYAHGFSAYVFTVMVRDEEAALTDGERNILSLINFDELDGIIYLPYTLSSIESTQYVEKFLQEHCTKPVIAIDMGETAFPYIWYDDRTEFAEVVEHLITVHGCRKIHCLTGQSFQQVAQNRLAGYRDAMDRAGLPYSDDDITFGDFWMYTAQELAQEFAAGVREMPDAIVCANDIMATSLCDAFAELGVSVPEDVIVTGYDGTLEASIHVPSLTTYSTSWKQLGRNAMCMLYEKITGMPMSPCMMESGTLYCRESCGCNGMDNSKHEEYRFDYRRMEDNYTDSALSARLLSMDNLRDFIKKTYHSTFVFLKPEHCGREMFTICLCEDWDKTEMDDYTRTYRTQGYSDRMMWIDFRGDSHSFPTVQLMPETHLECTQPSVTYFNPIHFQNRCYGYALLTLIGTADGYNQHYQRFCSEVSNGLEFLSMQNELKSLAYRRYLSQIRDDLTGLYNRKSFSWMWTDLLKTAKQFEAECFIVGFSVTGLHRLKETYGAIEKDKFLVALSEMIRNSCGQQEKCFRAREGEFLIIGIRKPENMVHEELIQKISRAFENHYRTCNYTFRMRLHHTSVTECSQFEQGEEILQLVNETLRNSQESTLTFSEQMHYDDLSVLRNEIYQNPERDWSVTMCCQRLNISPSYFQRIYRNAFGVSCASDIQKSKLDHAKKLLINTMDTLQTIAGKCGYDYSHFMRTFKKEVGMTPTEYRRGNAEKKRPKN